MKKEVKCVVAVIQDAASSSGLGSYMDVHNGMVGNVVRCDGDRVLVKFSNLTSPTPIAPEFLQVAQTGNQVSSQDEEVCNFCQTSPETHTQKKFQLCGGCGMVRYCSKDCQRKHWKAGHKMMCKLLKCKDGGMGMGLMGIAMEEQERKQKKSQ